MFIIHYLLDHSLGKFSKITGYCFFFSFFIVPLLHLLHCVVKRMPRVLTHALNTKLLPYWRISIKSMWMRDAIYGVLLCLTCQREREKFLARFLCHLLCFHLVMASTVTASNSHGVKDIENLTSSSWWLTHPLFSFSSDSLFALFHVPSSSLVLSVSLMQCLRGFL